MRTRLATAVAVCLAAGLALAPNAARAESALGPRLGLGDGDDSLFAGVQGEFGPAFGGATVVPGLDFGLGGGTPTMANLDLRFYLIPLPETGLRFYGSAGPSLVLEGDTELGLSLTLGLHVPMKALRRYNFEFRWGIGDIPDHKAAVAVMFGL